MTCGRQHALREDYHCFPRSVEAATVSDCGHEGIHSLADVCVMLWILLRKRAGAFQGIDLLFLPLELCCVVAYNRVGVGTHCGCSHLTERLAQWHVTSQKVFGALLTRRVPCFWWGKGKWLSRGRENGCDMTEGRERGGWEKQASKHDVTPTIAFRRSGSGTRRLGQTRSPLILSAYFLQPIRCVVL